MRRWFVACLASIVAILLANSPTGNAQTAAEYAADVGGKLKRESSALSSQQYTVASDEVVEIFTRGQSKQFRVELLGGTPYAIVGACDKDCGHVELALSDQAGQLLMRSPDKHDTVIINGAPNVSGSYTVALSVPGCKEQQCHAGLIILRQGTGPRIAIVKSGADARPAAKSQEKRPTKIIERHAREAKPCETEAACMAKCQLARGPSNAWGCPFTCGKLKKSCG
jgi:hypothetical protein